LPPDLESFDVAVVGRSLTGCLVAIALRERGMSVAELWYMGDNQNLERMIEVPPSSLSDAVISGLEFAERFWDRAETLGIGQGHIATILKREGDVFLIGDDERFVRAPRVVFAPAGTELPVDPSEDLYRYLGVGVSMDAWSDAPYIHRLDPQTRVAVVGCGFRAAEESLLCIAAGISDVLVVCSGEPSFGALAHRMSDERIHISARTRLGTLHGRGRELTSFDVIENGKTRREERSMIFLARGVQCSWYLLGGLRDHPGVTLAGLANGISYDDYPAMIADAARVAANF
jgi:thioredoxin reductase